MKCLSHAIIVSPYFPSAIFSPYYLFVFIWSSYPGGRVYHYCPRTPESKQKYILYLHKLDILEWQTGADPFMCRVITSNSGLWRSDLFLQEAGRGLPCILAHIKQGIPASAWPQICLGEVWGKVGMLTKCQSRFLPSGVVLILWASFKEQWEKSVSHHLDY